MKNKNFCECHPLVCKSQVDKKQVEISQRLCLFHLRLLLKYCEFSGIPTTMVGTFIISINLLMLLITYIFICGKDFKYNIKFSKDSLDELLFNEKPYN